MGVVGVGVSVAVGVGVTVEARVKSTEVVVAFVVNVAVTLLDEFSFVPLRSRGRDCILFL